MTGATDRAPVSPKDHITLFVDGFGVELHKSRIEGTRWKDGDSVSGTELSRHLDTLPTGD